MRVPVGRRGSRAVSAAFQQERKVSLYAGMASVPGRSGEGVRVQFRASRQERKVILYAGEENMRVPVGRRGSRAVSAAP